MIGCMVPCVRRKHELSPPHFKGKPVTLPVWSSAQAPPGVGMLWCRSRMMPKPHRCWQRALLISVDHCTVLDFSRTWPHSCARPCNEILFGQVVRRYPGSTYVEACHRSTVHSMLIGRKPVFSQVVQEPAVRSRPGLGHHARFHNQMKRFTRCIGTSVCHICCATSLTTYKIFFLGPLELKGAKVKWLAQ